VFELGSTEVPEDMFMELLEGISDRFKPQTFHIMQNNGNTFTDECAQLLLGTGIPKDILEG
jgi:hypothetical protein